MPESMDLTVDNEVIEVYDNLSKEWWNDTGPLQSVHCMKQFLYPYIKSKILSSKLVEQELVKSSNPFRNLKILDVGCGGGLQTEEIAKDGGSVVGIDISSKSIKIAQEHADLNPNISKEITYICESIEEHAKQNGETYEVIMLNYVLLHVTEQEHFLKKCITCLKPQGLIFITTINKSWLSWFLDIFLYEYVLGIYPAGFNVWSKYTSLKELERILNNNNCKVEEAHGFFFNCWKKKAHWLKTTHLDYISCAIKN